MAKVAKTVVIAAGQSLSPSIDCTVGNLAMIGIPVGWVGSDVSFQVSGDNVTFFDLFYKVGAAEATIQVVPGTAMLFDQDLSSSVIYLKIRSGTRIKPFIQTAARTIAVTLF